MDRISELALLGVVITALYAICGVAFGVFGGITFLVGRWVVGLFA